MFPFCFRLGHGFCQEKRFRLELEESVGRVRGRVDGVSKGMEQTKGELVALLNSKVRSDQCDTSPVAGVCVPLFIL